MQTFFGVLFSNLGHTYSRISIIFILFLGLHGIFVGVGEILGGLCFGILGAKLVRHGRDPVVLTGFVSTMTAFFLAFINIPSNAPIKETSDHAFITSNEYLALFTSFLLGRYFKGLNFNTTGSNI